MEQNCDMNYNRAVDQAKLIAQRTRIAYVYRLRNGNWYASSTPPSAMNADLSVTVTHY